MVTQNDNSARRVEMVTETRVSNAMRFLKAIWDGRHEMKPFSEPRLHCAMKDALELAIKAGLAFDLDDFSKLYDNFHMGSGYYVEGYLGCDERYYSLAVSLENIPACKSYEKAIGLKPFFMSNVDVPDCHYPGHWDLTKKRSRLTTGCRFTWNGERVFVTSFSKDKSYIVACSYKPREKEKPCPNCGRGGWEIGETKVNHVYKITHKDLRVKAEGIDGQEGLPALPLDSESKKPK